MTVGYRNRNIMFFTVLQCKIISGYFYMSFDKTSIDKFRIRYFEEFDLCFEKNETNYIHFKNRVIER